MMETEQEETNELNLTDFPNEILLEIFRNFNETSLLSVCLVCKRFKALAKTSVTQKYSGAAQRNYYTLTVFSKNVAEENRLYFPFLHCFGENVGAMSIQFDRNKEVPKNHWLILLIQRYCKLVTKLKIECGLVDLRNIIVFMSELKHLCMDNISFLNYQWTEYSYPKLEHFSLLHNYDLNHKQFSTFVKYNQQLKSLVVGYVADLKSELTNLKMDNLVFLEMGLNDNLLHDLSSIGCKNIEHLAIWNNGLRDELDIREIEFLSTFDKLKTLEISSFKLSFKLFPNLIRGLPNLVSFSLEKTGHIYDTDDELLSDLAFAIEICHKLSNLQFTISLLRISKFEFYKRFADITTSLESDLKLELCNDDTYDKIILTKEEARLIHESDQESVLWHSILYWKGYNGEYNLTGKNLLQLDEKVLLKIVSLLDGNALYAFSQTCRLAQQFVKNHLSQAILCSSFDPSPELHPTRVNLIEENAFRDLGEFIFGIKLNLDNWFIEGNDDEETVYAEKAKKYLQHINKYCGGSLCELKVKGKSLSQSLSLLLWQNLRKLSYDYINNQTLQMFHCAKLTALEIKHYEEINNVTFDCAQSFCNLTSLKFKYYNQYVENFLYDLNQPICNQLKDLSLDRLGPSLRDDEWFAKNKTHRWLILINIIKRFRHLITLDLFIGGIEKSRSKFLFESCSMLVKLSISAENVEQKEFLGMLSYVELNCKQIDVIQLYSKSCTPQSFLEKIIILFRKAKTQIKLINKY